VPSVVLVMKYRCFLGVKENLSTVYIQNVPRCYCPEQVSSVPNAASLDWLKIAVQ
jgi:hypothetical protein